METTVSESTSTWSEYSSTQSIDITKTTNISTQCGTEQDCPGPINSAKGAEFCSCRTGYLNLGSCCLSQSWIIGLSVGCGCLLLIICVSVILWLLHDRKKLKGKINKMAEEQTKNTEEEYDDVVNLRKTVTNSKHESKKIESGIYSDLDIPELMMSETKADDVTISVLGKSRNGTPDLQARVPQERYTKSPRLRNKPPPPEPEDYINQAIDQQQDASSNEDCGEYTNMEEFNERNKIPVTKNLKMPNASSVPAATAAGRPTAATSAASRPTAAAAAGSADAVMDEMRKTVARIAAASTAVLVNQTAESRGLPSRQQAAANRCTYDDENDDEEEYDDIIIAAAAQKNGSQAGNVAIEEDDELYDDIVPPRLHK